MHVKKKQNLSKYEMDTRRQEKENNLRIDSPKSKLKIGAPQPSPLFLSLCEWLTLPIVHFHRPPFLLIKIWKNQFFVSLRNYNRPNFIINFRNRFPFSLQINNKLYYYFCTVLKFTPLIHTSLFHTVSTSHINFTRFTDLSLGNLFYISCSPLNA